MQKADSGHNTEVRSLEVPGSGLAVTDHAVGAAPADDGNCNAPKPARRQATISRVDGRIRRVTFLY